MTGRKLTLGSDLVWLFIKNAVLVVESSFRLTLCYCVSERVISDIKSVGFVWLVIYELCSIQRLNVWADSFV